MLLFPQTNLVTGSLVMGSSLAIIKASTQFCVVDSTPIAPYLNPIEHAPLLRTLQQLDITAKVSCVHVSATARCSGTMTLYHGTVCCTCCSRVWRDASLPLRCVGTCLGSYLHCTLPDDQMHFILHCAHPELSDPGTLRLLA